MIRDVKAMRSIFYCGLVVMVLMAAATGCGGTPGEPWPEMHFDVDSTRLSALERFPEYDLQFHPPAGWEPAPAGQISEIGTASGGDRSLSIYFQPETQCALNVSEVTAVEGKSFSDRASAYGHALRDAYPGVDFRQAAFRKKGLRIVQYMAQPAGLVQFKLLVEVPGDGMLQFDYLAPRSAYENQVRSIESSIGSIQKMSSQPITRSRQQP